MLYLFKILNVLTAVLVYPLGLKDSEQETKGAVLSKPPSGPLCLEVTLLYPDTVKVDRQSPIQGDKCPKVNSMPMNELHKGDCASITKPMDYQATH